MVDHKNMYTGKSRELNLKGNIGDHTKEQNGTDEANISIKKTEPFDLYQDITFSDLLSFIKAKWTILSIFFLGLLLRVIHIGRESFWFDETLTGYRSQWTYPQLLENIAPIDQMPLYYTIMWFIGQNYGSGDILLRLPSAIFGTLAIIPAYYIGRRISRKAGLFSALLMAIIPTYIYYSQEARMYSLIILLSSIFFFFVLEYNHNILYSDRKYTKKWIIISGLLLLYTHYYSLMFVGLALCSTGAIEFFRKHETLKEKIKATINYSKPLIIACLSIIPWFIFLQFFHSLEGHETAGGYVIHPSLIPETFLFLTGMYKFLIRPDRSLVYFLSTLIFLLVILGVAWVIFKSRKCYKFRTISFISMPILIIPPIFSYLYSLNGMSIYAYRYFLFMAPFIVLFPALFMDHVIGHIKNNKIKLIPIFLTLIILVMAGISVTEMYREKEKEDWRSACSYLDKNVGDNEAILPIPAWKQMVVYYYERDHEIVHFQPEDTKVGETLENRTRIWAVISLNFWYSDAEPILNQLKNWTQVDSIEFNGLLVRCYEHK